MGLGRKGRGTNEEINERCNSLACINWNTMAPSYRGHHNSDKLF